jgi:hypothetical protein
MCLAATLAACTTSDGLDDVPVTATADLSSNLIEVNPHVNFAIRIESVSGPDTLVLPDGTATAAPISPGMIAVASIDNALFKLGEAAGDSGLQQLAEDGNPCGLIAGLAGTTGVTDAEFIIPNLHYRVVAKPGDRLYFASMFVHSNDLFYGFGPLGLPLFDESRRPVSGDMTQHVTLWDAGTELNQAPGVGPDQAPRQPAPGVGTMTKNPVKPVSQVLDGFTYPPTAKVIRITVTPDA